MSSNLAPDEEKPPLKPILLAGDDEDQILSLYESFRLAEINNPFFVVFDGQHAVDYLAGTGRFEERARYPFPCLVFLSMDLYGKEPLEVLEWICEAELQIRKLPVILCGAGPQLAEMKKALKLGAYDYVLKSLKVPQLSEWAKSLKDSVLSACQVLAVLLCHWQAV